MFFSDQPENAPALNKIPLVKWHRSYVYASSTHALLPRGLNLTYDENGGEKASGSFDAGLLEDRVISGVTYKQEVAALIRALDRLGVRFDDNVWHTASLELLRYLLADAAETAEDVVV